MEHNERNYRSCHKIVNFAQESKTESGVIIRANYDRIAMTHQATIILPVGTEEINNLTDDRGLPENAVKQEIIRRASKRLESAYSITGKLTGASLSAAAIAVSDYLDEIYPEGLPEDAGESQITINFRKEIDVVEEESCEW